MPLLLFCFILLLSGSAAGYPTRAFHCAAFPTWHCRAGLPAQRIERFVQILHFGHCVHGVIRNAQSASGVFVMVNTIASILRRADVPGWKLSVLLASFTGMPGILEHQAGFIGGIQNGTALLLGGPVQIAVAGIAHIARWQNECNVHLSHSSISP